MFFIQDFGLSISGYHQTTTTTTTQSTTPINGKPPIYNSGNSTQPAKALDIESYFYLDDEYSRNELTEDESSSNNKFDSYMGNVNSILPSYETSGNANNNKPKFKPTLATQLVFI